MEFRITSSPVNKASISREGRHIFLLNDNSILSVYRFQSSVEGEPAKPLWTVENVRSSIWHHEESKVLLSKRNGDLEWKLFSRSPSNESGRITAEQLLKHLILKRLEFGSLKQIFCLSFQRDFCILQTSSKQIVGLRLRTNLDSEVVWAIEVGEFAVWTFCDKNFINYEPHSKDLHVYSVFEGKVKHSIKLEFTENSTVSPVRKICSSPDGKLFAVLTEQLLVGSNKLQVLLYDGKSVKEISIGTGRIAILTQRPDEYQLFDFNMQKIYSCFIHSSETLIFGLQYDRVDRVMDMKTIRELKKSSTEDPVVSIDVRTSLLSTALNSQHLESSANVLKIAEQSDEAETCRILTVLDEFIQRQHQSPFGLQILGLSLGFAGRAFKKFPSCPIIFNLVFSWQDLLPLEQVQPYVHQANDQIECLAENSLKWSPDQMLHNSLLNNCLPLGQNLLLKRGHQGVRLVSDVRNSVINGIQTGILDGTQSVNEAELMIKHLGCDVRDSWEQLCLDTLNPELRLKVADILRQRHLLREDMCSALKFVVFVEDFVKDSFGSTPKLTLEQVCQWSPIQRRIYLAEAFLQTKNEAIVEKILPEDVWQVMLNKQILSSLRKWIENYHSSCSSDESIPYSWPVTDCMVDMAEECDNIETRESVLNLLALRGIFAKRERRDLTSFVARIFAINRFDQMESLLRQSTSNVNFEDLKTAVLDYCDGSTKPALFYDLVSGSGLDLEGRPTWMKLINEFKSLLHNQNDINCFLELCRTNNTYLVEGSWPTVMNFPLQHPFASLLLHRVNMSSLIGGEMETALKNLPMFTKTCGNNQGEPTVHQLLAGEVPINVESFFLWRQQGKQMELFPHFSNAELYSKHGMVTVIEWTFYLKQGRPFRTYFQAKRQEAVKMDVAIYPFAVQGIGQEDPFNIPASLSCVLFIEMLGQSSLPLRVTLDALDRIARESIDRARLTVLSRNLLTDSSAARNLCDKLESIFLKNWNSSERTMLVENWHLPVEFANIYGLDLPIGFLQKCAITNEWLLFLLYIQRYAYTPKLLLTILNDFASPSKDHLLLIIQLLEPTFGLENADLYWLLLRGSISSLPLPECSFESVTLSAVLDPGQVFRRLCIYLHLHLPESVPLDLQHLNSESLGLLILALISTNRFDVAVEAFWIFVPDHILTRSLNWLAAFSKGSTNKTEMERWRDFVPPDLSRDDNFFSDSLEPYRLAFQIFSWGLSHLIQYPKRQLELVTLWAEVEPFTSLAADVPVPDFKLMAEIMRLCLFSDIELDVSNLMQGNLMAECQKAIQILLQKQLFDVALKLAKLADLPADLIFVTQLATQLDTQSDLPVAQTLSFRTAFWKKCSSLLKAHRVRPDVASRFFRESLTRTLCHLESHLVAGYALDWIRLVKPTPVNDVAELDLLWWQYRIEADLEGVAPPLVKLATDPPSFYPLLMAKLSEWTIPYLNSQSSYSDTFLHRVTEWIDQDLDRQDLMGAMKLSAMFSRKSTDLKLILLLIQVAENIIDLLQAGEKLADIIPSKGLETGWKDVQSFFDYVDSTWLKHGHGICQRLSICHQVSLALDLKYDYVMEHPRPVYVLKMLLETPSQSGGLSLAIGGHLSLARSWIATCRINAADVVTLVKDELIEVARTAHCKINATESNMVVSLLVAAFNRFVTLCSDPTQLGRELLESALVFERDNERSIAVELLIFAHSSFTLACDVENISTILTHARCFVERLSLDQQWLLITRLTTGIQRYAEMGYVFALLKENDQFEYLLRKGMDRLPLLRLALLDFLRPNCLENRELFRLVALHFHMHAEVATMWQEEADTILKPMIDQASKSIVRTSKGVMGSPSSKMTESSPARRSSSLNLLQDATNLVIPMLKVTSESKKNLSSAMQNFVHAAEYYLQAGKLNHSSSCAQKAELIALQIHIVNRSTINSQVYCILELNAAQVNHLISEYFTFPEAEIIARCYGNFPVAWGRALMRHYVLNDESDYLSMFCRRRFITSTVVEEAVAAAESESGLKKTQVLDRFSRIISMVKDSETKYRIASRLGLRPLVGDLLSSSALPYLKDTTWSKKAGQD